MSEKTGAAAIREYMSLAEFGKDVKELLLSEFGEGLDEDSVTPAELMRLLRELIT